MTIFYKKLLLFMLQGCWDHLQQTTAWWKKSLLNFKFFQSFTFYMSSAKKISYHQQKNSWHCLTVLYCLEVLYFKWVYNFIFPSFLHLQLTNFSPFISLKCNKVRKMAQQNIAEVIQFRCFLSLFPSEFSCYYVLSSLLKVHVFFWRLTCSTQKQ